MPSESHGTHDQTAARVVHRDPVAEKLTEIRHQLRINVDIAKRDHPEGMIVGGKRVEALPHSQEILASHVEDRLKELEALIRRAPQAPQGDGVAEALRDHWHGVVLDGRNEHGAHVLTLPQRSIELELDPNGDFLKGDAEAILRDAEKLGFAVGDAVVIIFDLCTDEGFFSHYEYAGVSAELTALLYGRAALAPKEGAPAGGDDGDR